MLQETELKGHNPKNRNSSNDIGTFCVIPLDAWCTLVASATIGWSGKVWNWTETTIFKWPFCGSLIHSLFWICFYKDFYSCLVVLEFWWWRCKVKIVVIWNYHNYRTQWVVSVFNHGNNLLFAAASIPKYVTPLRSYRRHHIPPHWLLSVVLHIIIQMPIFLLLSEKFPLCHLVLPQCRRGN